MERPERPEITNGKLVMEVCPYLAKQANEPRLKSPILRVKMTLKVCVVNLLMLRMKMMGPSNKEVQGEEISELILLWRIQNM